MTTSELYEEITRTLPEIIYISGKTSTGKSTFARKLHDKLGYDTIGLEDILLDVIDTNNLDETITFHKVFYNDEPSKEKNLYLAETDKIIGQHLQNSLRLAIEGAVANSTMLRRILQPAGNLPVVYFHPDDLNVYIRNLTSRFMQSSKISNAGLPSNFWQHIDKKEFETFCTTRHLTNQLKASIRLYALESQQASSSRLRELQRFFSGLAVISIE